MFGWELIFAGWLLKTRSSEVQYLSVRRFLLRHAQNQLNIFNNSAFQEVARHLSLHTTLLYVRQENIWMPGVCSFGRQLQPYFLFSHLDYIL